MIAVALLAPGPPPPASSAAIRRSMQGNRRTDTKPEVALRSALHRLGLRFRKDHRLDLPGARVRPDIVFTRRRVAVFVDGCFWHCCPIHSSRPKTNQWYWEPKLNRNRERDALADEALANSGWLVVRIWEHSAVSEGVDRVSAALLCRDPAAIRRPSRSRTTAVAPIVESQANGDPERVLQSSGGSVSPGSTPMANTSGRSVGADAGCVHTCIRAGPSNSAAS